MLAQASLAFGDTVYSDIDVSERVRVIVAEKHLLLSLTMYGSQ